MASKTARRSDLRGDRGKILSPSSASILIRINKIGINKKKESHRFGNSPNHQGASTSINITFGVGGVTPFSGILQICNISLQTIVTLN